MSFMILLVLDVDASLAPLASTNDPQPNPIIGSSDQILPATQTERILFLDPAFESSNSHPLTCSANPACSPSNPRTPASAGSGQYWDATCGHSEMAQAALAAIPAIVDGSQYWDHCV